jgi:hypothetical protein
MSSGFAYAPEYYMGDVRMVWGLHSPIRGFSAFPFVLTPYWLGFAFAGRANAPVPT